MKFLIINPFGIGDVVFSTPLIEILKTNYPDSQISYVCNRRAYEIIKTNPHLHKIFIYEKDDYREAWRRSKIGCVKNIFDFLKQIKKEEFDIAVDLSLGYQYSMLLKFIGIRRRFGFNYRDRGRFLTGKIDIDGFSDKHVVEYYLDILKYLDIDTKKYKTEPKVYLTPADAEWARGFLKDSGVKDEDLLIGVIPGCGASWGIDAKYRRWDAKNFAMVADGLAEKYKAKIILFGDSKEVPICREVQGSMRHPAITSCGKTTIGAFLGLLTRCSLVVTNDGGPLHMAVGLGVRTVSIFGPVNEKVYGPYSSSPDHIVISNKDLPCRPCYRKFRYNVCGDMTCLKSIEAKEVLEAADSVLS